MGDEAEVEVDVMSAGARFSAAAPAAGAVVVDPDISFNH